MSRSDDTLQEALEQHLESMKATGKGDDWLRDAVQWLIQEILDLEFSQFLGADPYERSSERQGYRNTCCTQYSVGITPEISSPG